MPSKRNRSLNETTLSAIGFAGLVLVACSVSVAPTEPDPRPIITSWQSLRPHNVGNVAVRGSERSVERVTNRKGEPFTHLAFGFPKSGRCDICETFTFGQSNRHEALLEYVLVWRFATASQVAMAASDLWTQIAGAPLGIDVAHLTHDPSPSIHRSAQSIVNANYNVEILLSRETRGYVVRLSISPVGGDSSP